MILQQMKVFVTGQVGEVGILTNKKSGQVFCTHTDTTNLSVITFNGGTLHLVFRDQNGSEQSAADSSIFATNG